MLISNNQLINTQLVALQQLTALCFENDNGTPNTYPYYLDSPRSADSNVLYYANGQLVGFLASFFFEAHSCEVALMVAPAYRRKGIARQLIRKILPVLQEKNLKTVIFSMPPIINNGWLTSLGFTYCYSEYHMKRESYEAALMQRNLNIRKASVTDISVLCEIDALCFKKPKQNMAKRFNFLLNNTGYSVFLGLYKRKSIGKVHLRWEENSVAITDLAVLPTYQGNGYGSELLAYGINFALTHGKTIQLLEVETSNQNALNLYLRHGFKTNTVCEYRSISLQQLSILI